MTAGIEEWGVEVTWVDANAAGAAGSTSLYGPMTRDHADSFLMRQRAERSISSTRLVRRLAIYTPWEPETPFVPTSDQDRDAYWEHMQALMRPPGTLES